jgi:hypothetical protein
MSYEIKELYSIMPIANIPSIMTYGILSHKLAAQLSHSDISMQVVQSRRNQKIIPCGLPLHEYANLYFCARNPMMYSRKEKVDTICVLRINVNVAWQDEVFACDGNASSDYTRFYSRNEWSGKLDFDTIFMDDWTSPDPFQYMEQKRQKCAEVLVPNIVEPSYITGAYIGSSIAETSLRRNGFMLDIKENKHIFFL